MPENQANGVICYHLYRKKYEGEFIVHLKYYSKFKKGGKIYIYMSQAHAKEHNYYLAKEKKHE